MPTDAIVYLIHDHDALREQSGHIVEQMGVAAQVVESPAELIEAYDDSRDSCLITDLKLNQCSYLDLAQVLGEQAISIPSIVITERADVATAVEIMRHGAVTLIESPIDRRSLQQAITEAVLRDSMERTTKIRQHELRSRIQLLSEKERNVMEFVVDGMANKVIAKRLGVSIRTVESRRQAVFQKMRVNSLAELVRSVVEADVEPV